METCVPPNSQSAGAQAAVSAQEVQQIPEQGPPVWGRGQASRGRPGLTLYLHEVIKWKSGSTSVSSSRPLLVLHAPSTTDPSVRRSFSAPVVNNELAIVWSRGSAGKVWRRSDERWAVASCAEGLSPAALQSLRLTSGSNIPHPPPSGGWWGGAARDEISAGL